MWNKLVFLKKYKIINKKWLAHMFFERRLLTVEHCLPQKDVESIVLFSSWWSGACAWSGNDLALVGFFSFPPLFIFPRLEFHTSHFRNYMCPLVCICINFNFNFFYCYLF